MSKPTKDDVLRELIEFFLDGFSEDPIGVDDWLSKGPWKLDDFKPAVEKLKSELRLRD
jgi:hypothetical protein